MTEASRDVDVAGLRLRLPDGAVARRLSDPEHTDTVRCFAAASPDRTIYHGAPYIEFARAVNNAADMLLVVREGEPLFALPVHPTSAGFTTGYSGVLLPARPDAAIRRAVDGLAELLTGSGLGAHLLQATAQSPAYGDPGRQALIRWRLEANGLSMGPWYTRVLDLPEAAAGERPGDLLESSLMALYEPRTRNAVRQAVRRGVTVRARLLGEEDERAAGYAQYAPVHEESWRRTGMPPHSQNYWVALSRAVTGAGGHDVLVLAEDAEGQAVAGVVMHVGGERALYWASASTSTAADLRANPLCLHAAIAEAARLGARTCELGRFRAREPSEKERAITRYKAGFGGTIQSVISVVARERMGNRASALAGAAARRALARAHRHR